MFLSMSGMQGTALNSLTTMMELSAGGSRSGAVAFGERESKGRIHG